MLTDFFVVIPARYASERLPGKPLLPLAGKPMLAHVWERARQSAAAEVIIATDDERIAEAASGFGAEVCMTASTHTSGTGRIAEVADVRQWADEQVVVNLQGDEPLMPVALIDQCADLLAEGDADIGTLASPFADERDHGNPNMVKVIVDRAGRGIYFSRAAIPYSRGSDTDALARKTALHHHGIYAYRCGVLRQLVDAPPAAIESCERLEQLRAIYLGMTIQVGVPEERPEPGIDTDADLKRVERLLS